MRVSRKQVLMLSIKCGPAKCRAERLIAARTGVPPRAACQACNWLHASRITH